MTLFLSIDEGKSQWKWGIRFPLSTCETRENEKKKGDKPGLSILLFMDFINTCYWSKIHKMLF